MVIFNNYINRFVLQECGEFAWRVSDCEDLVWTITVEDGFGFMELVFLKELGKLGLS